MDARDLAWGLWLASMTAGIVFWFSSVLFSRSSPFRDKDLKHPLAALGPVLVVFLLFCLAHGLVHQTLFMLLMAFLPYGATSIEALAANGATGLFHDLYAAYWPIVVLTLVSWGLTPLFRPNHKPQPGDLILPVPSGDLIRLVLVVFLLAILHAAGLTRRAYYPVLLLLYLPVETLLKKTMKAPW